LEHTANELRKGSLLCSCGYFLSCLTAFGFAVRLITAPFLPSGDFGFSLGRVSGVQIPPPRH
jgi:hypothetical protein